MTAPSHICFAVPDIAQAMEDLHAVAGTRWAEVRELRLDEWDYRIVFSLDPPHIELIEGPPGSPWEAADGPRFDHLGWWSADLDRTVSRLAGAGLPLAFDGRDHGRGFAYHDVASIGARFEAVDAAGLEAFRASWGLEGLPCGALESPRGGPAARAEPADGDEDDPDGPAFRACRETLLAFLGAVDRGRASTAIDLFTDDARVEARGSLLEGRAEIAGFLAEREADSGRQTVHLLTNEVARRSSTEEVEIEALVVVLLRGPTGSYSTELAMETGQLLRRTADGWRIARRSVRPVHPDPVGEPSFTPR